MISPRQWIALAAAGLFALAMPALLLRAGPAAPSAPPPPPAAPIAAPEPPPLAAAYERGLFGGGAGEAASAPADAPSLAGIVGRLDQDAVALVRTADGSSRSLAVGESVDGWKLESLAIDAAFFTRGSERVRVALPEN